MKKGNLYYYFRNKEEILFACHQYSLDRLLALLEEIDRSDAPADDKLRRLIVAFVHTILDELHGTALFLDLEALSPAHRRTVIARRDRFDRGMRRIIAPASAPARSVRCDPKLLSFAILGAVNWIPRWFKPDGPLELAGDRRSVRRLPDRRPARIAVRLKADSVTMSNQRRPTCYDHRSPWPRSSR